MVNETNFRPRAKSSAGRPAEPKPPFPAQHQDKPGREAELVPRPRYQAPTYRPAKKLEGKVAVVTGGDSGIGRAVAVLFAREGANIVFTHLASEAADAKETQKAIETAGQSALPLEGDLRKADFCQLVIDETLKIHGRLDILVSNAGHQNRKDLGELTDEEMVETFETNIFALIRLCRNALPHLAPGSAIIATSSETGLLGSSKLPDYSSTKGAINAFVKSMAQDLACKGIRVNAVAPGPVWMPLNPSDNGLPPEKVAEFGSKSPMGRPAQPEELAPAYVFLASEADSSYISGIALPVMGGVTSG
ncbi:MAG: short-chain dehydrogenase [Bradyrhizobium sp.]|nr:short-chain dehydrogenase [Bradyrhizobium sp.]